MEEVAHMFELHQIGKNTFYIESPAKIGIYRVKESDVYLIDSGNDKDAGRKIRKILDEQGWNLKGIINTTPTQTISAATGTCSSRQAALFLLPASRRPLPGSPFWSLLFCTAAIPAKIFATNSCWLRTARQRRLPIPAFQKNWRQSL